jgi:hypothetical protein
MAGIQVGRCLGKVVQSETGSRNIDSLALSLPGCKVESTIFFACHSSGDMEGMVPSL